MCVGGRNGIREGRVLRAESPISDQEREGSETTVGNVPPDAAVEARPAAFSKPAARLLVD